MKMRRKEKIGVLKILVCAVLLGLALLVKPAFPFSCSISASDVNFGTVNVISGLPVTTTGTLSLTCSGSPSNQTIRMCVNIDGGTDYDATSRKMVSGGSNTLRYQLYSDNPMAVPWGSWVLGIYGGGHTWDVFCTSATCTATTAVYAQVPSGQSSVVPGSYSSNLALYFTYNNKNDKVCPDPGKGNATASFTASATVPVSCGISTTNMNFGTAGFLTSNVDATSTVTVTCTNTTTYSVSLGNGNTGTGPTSRKMVSGANNVTYGLYRDAARVLPWGSTIGTNTSSGTGTSAAQLFTVYGRVPVQTTPPPGTYTDTVVVTVTY